MGCQNIHEYIICQPACQNICQIECRKTVRIYVRKRTHCIIVIYCYTEWKIELSEYMPVRMPDKISYSTSDRMSNKMPGCLSEIMTVGGDHLKEIVLSLLGLLYISPSENGLSRYFIGNHHFFLSKIAKMGIPFRHTHHVHIKLLKVKYLIIPM